MKWNPLKKGLSNSSPRMESESLLWEQQQTSNIRSRYSIFLVDQDLPYMIFYARLLHHELFFSFIEMLLRVAIDWSGLS